MSCRPDWLVARPIAHRGLHDRAAGRIENSRQAALAAVERGFAVECDVQLSADGEAMVFHDFTLDRLTAEKGPVRARKAAELEKIRLEDSTDGVLALPAFLDLVAGRVPLVVEIKSRFDGDLALTRRVAEIVAGRRARIAIKSFDPDAIAYLRENGAALGIADVPFGIVGESAYSEAEWPNLPADKRTELPNLLHYQRTRPDFLSWRVDDLPDAAPFLCRAALGLPVMTWTVRTPAQRANAGRWADQIVFEGFVP
ncbi:MAG: glycerophosphodiester phosphodiesterase [Hyphomicrobiales bacterium]|nr:glycerophosphodiester phosphodiesterase [Hyphomicrobiales bacterium]